MYRVCQNKCLIFKHTVQMTKICSEWIYMLVCDIAAFVGLKFVVLGWCLLNPWFTEGWSCFINMQPLIFLLTMYNFFYKIEKIQWKKLLLAAIINFHWSFFTDVTLFCNREVWVRWAEICREMHHLHRLLINILRNLLTFALF